ncbi:MAG: Ig-like domain-containing protein [Thermoplasmatota archaeon]
MKNLGSKAIFSIVLVLLITAGSLTAMAEQPVGENTRAVYPYPARVHLELEYENTDPASGFTVKFYNYYRSPPEVREFTTDPAGEVSFQIEAPNWGPCKLWAYDTLEDFFWTADLLAEPNGNYDLNGTVVPPLPFDNHLHGIVKDAGTGVGIPGVMVDIDGLDAKGRTIMDNTLSGGDGSYSFMLPDSFEPYGLAATMAGYEICSAEVYIPSGSNDITIDLWMNPEYSGPNTLNVKGFNSTTGDEMELTGVSLYGVDSLADHTNVNDYSYTPDTITGYHQLEAGWGEYSIRANTRTDPALNVSFELYNFVLVNDTDVFHHIQFPIPAEWRQVNVHLEDESGPLFYAYADYYLNLDGLMLRGETHTDPSGDAVVFIPAWTDVELDVWDYSYERKYIDIEAGPPSSVVNIDETLDYVGIFTPPTGQLSLLVTDEVTGLPVPYTRVRANTYLSEEGYWISIYGTTSEDGYLNKSVDAGLYPEMFLESNLGTGTIKNVAILETGTNSYEGTITRRDFPPAPVEVSFYLVDAGGGPVPNHPVTLSGTGTTSIDHEPISDGNGKVTLWILPGTYRVQVDAEYECIRGLRSSWTSKEIETTITSGGTLPDIILYPTKPLISIEGFVRDAATGDVIPQEQVYASSYHDLTGEPTRQVPYVMDYFEQFMDPDEERLYFFWNPYSGSMEDGFYRVWGADKIVFYADREGYYYYNKEVDLSTRGDVSHDILMEPIPEYTTYVNGTLVDQDGGPLSGFVALLDVPHEHYIVDEMMVNDTGEFSLECYPGDLRALFGNESLWDFVDISVPPEGIEGLELVLAPSTFLNGTVKDWKGDPLTDVNVTLERLEMDEFVLDRWMVTGADGNFSFPVERGTYNIVIEGTDEYLEYVKEGIETSGWEPIHLEVVLMNRTSGKIFGKVTGSGGPLEEGIPGSMVILSDPEVDSRPNTTTNENGEFMIENVPYGDNWTVKVQPPEDQALIPGIRSGYLENATENVSVSMAVMDLRIILPFVEVQNEDLVNVLDWSPRGEDVAINEMVWIEFSEEMDRGSVEAALQFSPTMVITAVEWNGEGTRIMIHHDDLLTETNYTVIIPGYVVSSTGMPMEDPAGFSWTFRTGTEALEWYLDSAEVLVGPDKFIDVEATGGEGQTVFIVIDGIGSFALVEGSPGTYSTMINGELLEWGTTYGYHFSDTDGGEDKWPAYKGTFTTPNEPADDDTTDDDTGDDDTTDDDTGDDDDEESTVSLFGIFLAACGIILVIVLVIALVIFLATRKKGGDWEE